MLNGTKILAATMPKNRPLEISGWFSTKSPSTPAMVKTMASMPSARSPSSHQSACRNAALVRTARSLPRIAERMPSTMCAPVSSRRG